MNPTINTRPMTPAVPSVTVDQSGSLVTQINSQVVSASIPGTQEVALPSDVLMTFEHQAEVCFVVVVVAVIIIKPVATES